MLVLASASPRRRELLTQAGYTFSVHPANIPEDLRPGEDPVSYVTRLAREKAEAVFRELSRSGAKQEIEGRDGQSSIMVLGADTTVAIDGMILGKPENAVDAERMLRLLSGRSHRVITGVALVFEVGSETGLETAVEARAEITEVRFLPISDEEIRAYAATGEPMDKAGAYGIQGRAARWIPRIEGCYFNVVGLPLALVVTMIESRGIRGR